VVKVILVPIFLERLVVRMDIREEIKPIINVPLSVVISGGLTLLGYVVAESFYTPDEQGLGHNELAVAISLFLIGFFTMINRRKALTQVLALLSLENGLFLAAISLTYGMPLMWNWEFYSMCWWRLWCWAFLSTVSANPSSPWM